jgi:hypothetical protein
MKTLFFVACICLVLFLPANSLAQQNPTVDEVVDGYVKALGGKEALQKLTSRISKGFYKIPSTGINIPLEIYAKAPNKIMLKVKFTEKETIQRVFNGKDEEAWAKDLNLDGVRSIEGSELSLLKTKADFYWAINLKSLYPQLTFKEKKTITIPLVDGSTNKKEVYILESKDEKKPKETFYFDTKTALLVFYQVETEILEAKEEKRGTGENSYTVLEPGKKIVPIEIYYENYKEIDGVKIPMTTRQAISENNIIVELNSVEHNKPVDEKLFAKPK